MRPRVAGHSWPTLARLGRSGRYFCGDSVRMNAAEQLDSWKEIARYLKRSVRTARRWEQQQGLPVHRSLGGVFARKPELDAWRAAQEQPPAQSAAVAEAAGPVAVSIAVLPFENLSTDPQNEYFAAGLTEEITTVLSKVQALRVTSRTSTLALRRARRGAPAIAKLLRVRYLLEGSVRRAGERLRISAQLIDAVRDVHLWADSFDGTIDDVFAMQAQLAQLITAALKLHLTSDDQQRLAQNSIPNVAAYECYLRARQEGWRWRRDSIDRAVQLLEQALRIGGGHARLYAALGVAHLQYREAGIDLSERPLANAERCAQQLLALQPGSAAALQLRGWINYSRGLLQQAVHDLKGVLEREPHNADALLLLCNCYLVSGRVPAARPLLARLARVDPLTPLSQCMPAFADIMEGEFARALRPYRQMFEMDPANPLGRLFYVWVLLLNGRTRQARALTDACPADVHDTLAAQLMRLLVVAAAGSLSDAQARLSPELEAAASATDMFPRMLAQGFALAGRGAPALHWLQCAIERGFINYPYLARHDPTFRTLRQDAGFKRLLALARTRWEAFAA
jgi:TolB-like protein/thioredoxin-like negative regulator of GroEL